MTLNCKLFESEFSVLSSRLIIRKLSKICFLCTYVDQMIIQHRFNVLLQLQFYNIFTNVLSKVFTDILKIFELPKIFNKPKYYQTLVFTIIIYQANSISQLHQAFDLYPFIENVP